MVAFLTSSFVPYRGEYYNGKTPLSNENGFADRLRIYWKNPARFLVIAADPDDAKKADAVARQMQTTFSDAGFPIEETRLLDRRTEDESCKLVSWATVIFLSGGHAPTENAFINEIHLRELLKGFEGIFIGLSAGSLNAADSTIQIPELPGESDRTDFPVILPGLGITPFHIVPHAAYFKNLILDGKCYYDEILLPLSFGKRLYFIEDGSYFLVDGGITEFFGNGEIIENGSVQNISTCVKPEVWQALMGQGYSAAFSLDEKSGLVNFTYVSDFLKNAGFSPAMTPDFPALIQFLSEHLVVEEEKQAIIDLTQMSDIVDEVKRYGSFSRTVHYEADGSRHSADIRILPAGNELFGYVLDNTEALDRDWLTDTFSRTGFIKAAERFLQDAEDPAGYSLVYTNISGFKTINDLFGQESGDMVIFMVQFLLGKIFDPQFLCRLENDHFVFLTENDNVRDELLGQLASQTYEEKYRKYTFKIRCGVVGIHSKEASVSDLIDRARIAEKSIREDAASNWKVLDDSMQKAYIRRGAFVSELSDALEHKEFKTYYQPIVDTKSGKIVTAESLIRWKHHDLGMISPGEFIPLFEETGKTSVLDTFMLKSVAQLQTERYKAGKPLVPVSVNLSRIDFFDTLLIEDAKKIFASIPFQPSMLKLEITESAYADIETSARTFLKEMRSMGVKILLDDYGSGMSSLSTLESFEFDTVKLDMGFIRKIGKSKAAEAIIRSTIALAHDLGSDIIAEGVENKEQLDFLADAGCEMIQGYYFYKPVSEEEFDGLLDA